MLIAIDTSEVSDRREALSAFLSSKVPTPVTAKGKTLLLELEGKSASDIRTLLKHFLHLENLSEAYRVTGEKGIIKITRRKEEEKQRHGPKGAPVSPYETMPYFFPNGPQIRKPKLPR